MAQSTGDWGADFLYNTAHIGDDIAAAWNRDVMPAVNWAGQQLGLVASPEEAAYQNWMKTGADRAAAGDYYDTVTRPEDYKNINSQYTDAASQALTGVLDNSNNFINQMLQNGTAYDVNQFYQRTAPTITNYVQGALSPLEQSARQRMATQGRETINQVGDEMAGLGSLYSGATRRTAADRVANYNAQTMESLQNTQAGMLQSLINSGLSADQAGRITAAQLAGQGQSQALSGLTQLGEQNYVAPIMAMNPQVQAWLNANSATPQTGGGTDPLDLALTAASLIPGPQQIPAAALKAGAATVGSN
jgi:hypothetical protein